MWVNAKTKIKNRPKNRTVVYETKSYTDFQRNYLQFRER